MGRKRGSSRVGAGHHEVQPLERRCLLSAAVLHIATASEPNVVAPIAQAKTLDAEQGSGTPIGYTPTQISDAYGLNLVTLGNGSLASGAGQTIAIIDGFNYPTARSDLHAFDTTFALPDPPSFRIVNDLGQTSPLPGPDPDASANGYDAEIEESLDIEWAHAMAPGANLILFEASGATDADIMSDLFTAANTAAHTPGVTAVSMSFGFSEFQGETSDDPIFTTPPGHVGITFVASAGDNGASNSNTSYTPVYPAASPNVVAVGGTTLTLSGDAYVSETVWNDEDGQVQGATGGGISSIELQPGYQTADAQRFSTTQRTYPDVSLDGDPETGVPIYNADVFGSSTPWLNTSIGGTSLSAPLFAGMISDTNQLRANAGETSLNGLTQTLPDLYSFPSNEYHDITIGNNSYEGEPGYQAGVGYDLASGLGSPVANNLLYALAGDDITGTVFSDSNTDGLLDNGEMGVTGVTVNLYSAGGDTVGGGSGDVLIQTTTTNAAGEYLLNDPATSGAYFVNFVLPAGYHFSRQQLGAANGSKPNTTSGDTPTLMLTNVSMFPNEDAGIYEQTVSINSVSELEGNVGLTPFVFTVSLGVINSTAATAIAYTTDDGTATVAHGDYVPTSGTLIIPAGQDTGTITVDAVGNTIPELTKTFFVVLTQPAGFSDGTLVGTGSILNDDFPSASIAGSSAVRLPNMVEDFPFTVTLNETAPFTVVVGYKTADDTAISSLDYTAETGTLTFLPGVTTQTIEIPVLPSLIPQDNKDFYVKLSTAAAAMAFPAMIGTPSQAVGTIVTNQLPGISIANATLSEPLASATALMPFVVSVEPAQSTTTTLIYGTSDGTALAGVDYQAQAGTLTFAPGQVQQTVYIPIDRRFTTAGSLTFNVTIGVTSATTLATDQTVATGTIVDPGTVTLPFTGRSKATYTDVLNDPVNVSLRGPGTGQVVFLGTTASATNAYEILLDGTTSASTLLVNTRHGEQTPFQTIVDSGSLGAITGRGANLLASLNVAGSLNDLTLNFLQGATLDIGGGTGSLTLNFGRAIDTTINSAIPIASLTADAYLSTNGAPATITAPSVGPIRVRQTFSGTVVHAATVADVTAGDLSGVSLLATDSIGNVSADTIAATTLFAGVQDGLDTLPTSAAQFASTAGHIGAVRVKAKAADAFSDSLIAAWTVGAVKLGSVQVADGGTPFGVSGNQIASLTTTGVKPLHLLAVGNATPTLLDQDFLVDGVSPIA